MGERFARVARVSRSRSSFGPGMRALVRADPAGAVVLDPHAGEDAVARARLRRRGPCSPARAPTARASSSRTTIPSSLQRASTLGRVAVRIGAVLRQVDLDHVVRRTAQELRSLGRVDHVIGRGGHRLQAADLRQVVVKGVEGFDVGHLQPSLGRCVRA